ncbi:MAG: UDP-2-acetamido-2-deoxy-3-oxo-D-glucuronate aminotransferase [Owenweeksia sp. TMED14]|nr:MAG: UDP-2-acetamido-2-deoxy-3-oxo-D-glucuronate aminotransferase [Owenweeksia sp. TMED14]
MGFSKPIHMVDLRGQHEKIQHELNSSILKVIHSGAYINGPEVLSFANKLGAYLDIEHVIPCANGTDALQIALMSLDLKPGDEVITATFTYVASAEVISLLGLKVVLVDIDPDFFGLDIDQVKSAITSKTKAIIPVHLYGQGVHMETLLSLASEYDLAIIEDTAQSIGASYNFTNGSMKMLGTIGTIGCTSFFPSKNLGCMGDGGAIFTKDALLAEKIRMISNHGQKVKYHHDLIGCNSRLDTIQAAILEVKIKYLDSYNISRQKAATFYDEALNRLESIQIPKRRNESSHVFHQYTIRVLDGSRDSLAKFLKKADIPTMIYYPIPLHSQKAFVSDRYSFGTFPISEKLSNEVLSLPMHTELDDHTQSYIVNSIKEFYTK